MKQSFLYRFIAVILIMAICLPAVRVRADEPKNQQDTESLSHTFFDEDSDSDNNDKPDSSVASITDATLGDPTKELNCKAAAVIDVKTGNMLFEYNSNNKYCPGGLLKLMTALVVFEKGSSSDVVRVSGNKYYEENADYMDVVIYSGEQIPVKDLLYGLILKSGNESAYALAEYVSQDAKSFADDMNSVAKELGCKNSTFSGPNNDYASETSSSAYDMALIAAALYRHPLFRTIIETENYFIPATNKSEERELWQDNRMKYYANTDYYYKYHIGGKVGYSDIGGCFVSFAEKDGMTIACVVLGANPEEMIYSDTVKLCNHVFNSYQRVYPLRNYKLEIDPGSSALIRNYYSNVGHSLPYYYLNDNICINVEKGFGEEDIRINPVLYSEPEGDKAGILEIYYKDKLISQSYINVGISSIYDKATNSGELATLTVASGADTNLSSDKDSSIKKIAIYIILIISVIICILLIILMILSHRIRKKRKNNKKPEIDRKTRSGIEYAEIVKYPDSKNVDKDDNNHSDNDEV